MLAAGGAALVACSCCLAVLAAARGQHERVKYEENSVRAQPQGADLNFTEIVRSRGYRAEEHTVVTADGYLLTVFRIPKGKNCRGLVKKPPVLLMHGLLMSSDSWLDAGPSAGLAYLLADACYDLWAGNIRGNYYGRRHLRLDPDSDAQFWKFSTHEMGTFDLPATIDYVLSYTKSPDFSYVGFSQGSRIFFTMCSELTGYCKKARVSINMAPGVRLKYTRSLPVKFLTIAYAAFAPMLMNSATLEALPKGGLFQVFPSYLCRYEIFAASVCKLVLSLIDSYDPGSVLTETVTLLYDHFPGGTSAYTMAIYGQNAIAGRFQKYDHGVSKNLEMYGEVRPPLYNLTRATGPVVLIYGKNDFLEDPRDVRWLSKQLPNVLENYEVTRPTWNHLDHCYSQYTNRMIFPKIDQYLKKYSYVL